ncbi:MAG: copper amine oxidase N-terminal domain-containing protein [Ruminococcaceae bacterium]|nr:copper amine oxidase N-terminal domain-containing protein [Oscillospiraceae bacterium]
MKKILSFLAATALAFSAVPASFAEVEPTIRVDGRKVDFLKDQAPIIMNDRLYVPVRRVLEKMGATVDWNDKAKMVTVLSDNNIVKLELTIDNKEITKYTFTTVLNAEKETITSDVAPVIVNDRTMLPIRVIAEAIGATVVWNEETKLTSITTRKAKRDAEVQHGADINAEDFDVAEFFKEKVPNLSLACDTEDVNEGDIVEVKIKLSDLEKAGENKKIVILTSSISYNEENFKYSGIDFFIDGEKVKAELSAGNDEFMLGVVKAVALNTYFKAFTPGEDDVIAVVYFTALNDEGGEFALYDGTTELGSNTSVTVYEEIEEKAVLTELVNHDEIYIDTTAVTVK